MENSQHPVFPATRTTMTSVDGPMSSSASTLATSSSVSYHSPTVQYLPPINGCGQLYHQTSYPYYQNPALQPLFQYPRYPVLFPPPQPNPVSGDQGGIMSKAARDDRSMACQRRLLLSRSAAASGSSSSSTQMDFCGANSYMLNTDLCMPDMKELKVLFKKELKKSDVGPWGRIVIPKKEAEKYLPRLVEKHGIVLRMRDVHSSHVWGIKYKFWANNRSRMYVFESAGSFIRENELEVGDGISLYEDESKNFACIRSSEVVYSQSVHDQENQKPCTDKCICKVGGKQFLDQENRSIEFRKQYFSIEKAGTRQIHVAESSNEQQHYTTNSEDNKDDNNSNFDDNNHKNNVNNDIYMNSSKDAVIHSESASNNTKLYTAYTLNEEDEWYLAALLEDESNKVVSLSADPGFSYGRVEEANCSIDNVTNESSASPAMAGIWTSVLDRSV